MASLDIALELYDKGYCPIPVPLGKKHPFIKWKAFQTEQPSRSQIEAWFKEEANIAVLTGEHKGIVVVDADSAEACDIVEEICEPAVLKVSTSKGRHYYYKHPTYKVPNKVKLMDTPPIDIRGEGGLVIGPGSIHHSGKPYKVLSNEIPHIKNLSEFNKEWFPLWERELAITSCLNSTVISVLKNRSQVDDSRSFELAKQYVNKVPGAVSGSAGNTTTYKLACRLIRGFNLSDHDALSLLLEWNSRCLPPWSDSELTAFVRNARSYGNGDFGGMLPKLKIK